MKGMLFVFCLFVSVVLCGQAPHFEWAAQQGGGFVDYGLAIATDSFGNVYTTGSFGNNDILSDTADFDSGPGFYGLFSNGDSDIFVSKLNADGDLVWAVSFGNEEGDYGHGITTDAIGNVYVTGLFRGAVDFDPGSGVFTLSAPLNHSSAFVLKLDTNGSFLWVRELGDGSNFASGSSWGYSIAVDDDGNVYTTGQAKDNTDFDPGPGEYILTTNTNSSNIFISKLDSDGNFVWAKAIGGEEGELSYAIALDGFNNVYITGNFQSEIDFDPGSDMFNLTAIGNGDIFILKLNSEGDFVWVKNIGGDSTSAWGFDLAIDEIGNIYATGVFNENVDFDPGTGVYELSATEEKNFFVLKLHVSGIFIWAKSIGGVMGDFGNAITLDNYNNVYVTGYYRDTVDFDPGIGTYNLIAVGGDAFILKLDADGSFIWASSYSGGNETDYFSYNRGESIIVDNRNNVFITGSFVDTTDFDPDSTIFDLIAYGNTDIFVLKMSQPCFVKPILNNNNNNNNTICEQESITLSVVLPSNIGGAGFYWNTGDTSDFIIATPDSNAVYSLIVNYMENNVECSFTDSVEVIVLPIPDTTIMNFTTCDSLEIGVIEYVYSSQNGCDSIVMEIITFIPIPIMPLAPSDLVIQENELPFQLTIAEVLHATEYQWTVPAGMQILSGQGSNTVTIDWANSSLGGSVCVYALNECGESTADCMEVSVDIMDSVVEIREKKYQVFPNPTTDVLHIEFAPENHYQIILFDVFGRQMSRTDLVEGHTVLATKHLPSGVYWLQITNIDAVYNSKQYWEKIEIVKD